MIKEQDMKTIKTILTHSILFWHKPFFWPMPNLDPCQFYGLMPPRPNFDSCHPRHFFDPRQNFDPRHPRHVFDPCQNFTDPRHPCHPRQSLTHATHEPPTLPTRPTNPHYLADCILNYCDFIHNRFSKPLVKFIEIFLWKVSGF